MNFILSPNNLIDRAIQFLFDIPRDESGKQLPESDGLLKFDMCDKKFRPRSLNGHKNTCRKKHHANNVFFGNSKLLF